MPSIPPFTTGTNPTTIDSPSYPCKVSASNMVNFTAFTSQPDDFHCWSNLTTDSMTFSALVVLKSGESSTERVHPWKFKMKAQNEGLENDFLFFEEVIFRFHVHFPGCRCRLSFVKVSLWKATEEVWLDDKFRWLKVSKFIHLKHYEWRRFPYFFAFGVRSYDSLVTWVWMD